MSDKPKLDDRFIMRIEGREFVKYPGLLDLAHQKGISRIEVEALQFPVKENGSVAICKAVVVSKEGDSFSDIGDASPENVNSRIVKHLLRMASTRAIARALRSFTNIGMTCLEELADIDEAEEAPKKARKTNAPPKAPDPPPEPQRQTQPKMSDAQKKAIHNLAQRRGITGEELEKRAVDAYGTALAHLSTADTSQFIRSLQQAA
jgi:hypothetical protein